MEPTVSSSQSILPPLPTQPIADPPGISSYKPSFRKESRLKKIMPIVGAVLGIGLLGTSSVFAYSALRTTFNPVISPVVEDILYSPGQQLSARMNLLIDTVAVGSVSELRDLGGTVSTTYTDKEVAQYKKNIGAKLSGADLTFDSQWDITLNKPVLGENTGAGAIDENFINELMTTSTYKLTVAGVQSLEFRDRTNVQNKGGVTVSLKLPKNQVSMSLESLSANKSSYVMLSSFPENDYIDFSSLFNKWIWLDTAESMSTVDAIKSATGESQFRVEKEEVEKYKQVLSVPELLEKVEKAPSQEIGGKAAKCYTLILDTQSSKAIVAAMEAKAKELKLTESNATPTSMVETTAATTKTTLCYVPGSFIPNKIISESEFNDTSGLIKQSTTVTLLGLSPAATFAAPDANNTIKATEIDYTKLLKPAAEQMLYMKASPPVGSNADDIQRQYSIDQLLTATVAYYADYASYPACKNGTAMLSNGWSYCPGAFTSGTKKGFLPLMLADYLESAWPEKGTEMLFEAGTGDQLLRYYVKKNGTSVQSVAICTVFLGTSSTALKHYNDGTSDCYCAGSGASEVRCMGMGHR